MSHSDEDRARAIVGNCLAEDSRVNQSFAPYRKSQRRPCLKRHDYIAVGDECDDCSPQCADSVIHLIDEEALRIGHVTGHVKRQVLAAAAGTEVITPDYS